MTTSFLSRQDTKNLKLVEYVLSPERTTVPRQAVKCEARNPCNKDYKTIRVPKVRQKISRQKQKGRRFFYRRPYNSQF